MTLVDGRAPRSAVLGSARSRSFVAVPGDGVPLRAGLACRPEPILTPERLRP